MSTTAPARQTQTTDDCVHRLFEAQVARTPTATALLCAEESITFAELDERANALAQHLRRLGCAPETLTALLFENSIEAVVAMLAVLKTGGGYVVLDVDAPTARLKQVLDDARPLVAVSVTELADRLPNLGLPLVLTDRTIFDTTERPESVCLLDNLAYVTYTSGTTGAPKGVIATHRSILNGLNDVPFRRDEAEEICALTSPLSFGFSVAWVFLPLLCGVPVRIIPTEDVKDVRRFATAIDRGRVTALGMVTPLLRQLLAAGPATIAQLRRLRTVTVGGAPLTADLARSFAAALPNARLLNGYATSEAGGAVLVTECSTSPDRPAVGRPFVNTRVVVLDAQLAPAAEGEIYVSAAHLSRGYLGRADLTAARFVADPLGEPGTRLYRTGDLGRIAEDGGIEVLGRVDDDVKIRGYRVNLIDVEAMLRCHPQVRDVAVSVDTTREEPRLVAYVVPHASTVTSMMLREFAEAQVPTYMVPSVFSFLDSLPTTSTGKLDRQALPPADVSRQQLERSYVAPRSSVETIIAQIWADALGLDRVGIHDDFLDLGGDSLIATQIVARVWETFATEVAFETLFERPTVAGMVEQCFPDLAEASASAAQVNLEPEGKS
ncbi:MAG: non-ribosomal peptide synthetase [Vicinamibacterales bacterium]